MWDAEEITRKAVDDIRSKLALDDSRIATDLADYMEFRIEELLSGLDYVVQNSPLPDQETALKASQYEGDRDRRRAETQAAEVDFDDYKAEYDLAYVEGLRLSVSDISSAPNRVEAFSRFAYLENALEPVETDVGAMVRDLDEAIDLEIDRMRGK